MKIFKIYSLLAATMLMVAACGSDDDEPGGSSGSSISQTCNPKTRSSTKDFGPTWRTE